MIPFPFFAPDRSKYAVDASPMVRNCLPVADGWGPLPQFVRIAAEALPAAPKGVFYGRNATGVFRIFAGTVDGLYEFDTSDYGWNDVSGTTAPYAVPEGDEWQFHPFGTNLIAVQLGNAPQVIDLNSGTQFADLGGNPPNAKYVGSAGDFLVLAHLVGNPVGLVTSALGNAEGWTIGLNLAGNQDFPDGEDIQGILSGEKGAYIFQRRKIRQLSVTYNANYPFAVDVVNASRGVIAPLSMAGIGPDVFGYLSSDGFCVGINGQPIGGEVVDRWFNSTIDSSKLLEVRGAADPYNKIIWWQATQPDQTKFMIGWNWQLNRWCYSDQNTASLADLVTPAITWDGADDLFANWDDADVPWDSRILTGGLPTFGGFDGDNYLGFFTGGAMEAELNTGLVQLSAGRRSFLREARVMGDAENYTLAVGTADRHGGLTTFGTGVSPFPSTGICHYRSPGLLHKFRMTIEAGEVWQHITGLTPTFEAEGQR